MEGASEFLKVYGSLIKSLKVMIVKPHCNAALAILFQDFLQKIKNDLSKG